MQKHWKTVNWVILFLLAVLHVRSQDVHVSQFMDVPLLRNPALAGIFKGDYRAGILFRSQWQSVGVPFRTASLNAEYKIPIGRYNDYMTAGLTMLYDEAGASLLRQTQTLPVLNFHKSLDATRNRYLSIGFAAGLATRGLNARSMTFDNQFISGQFSPGAPSGERSIIVARSYLDLAVGMTFNASIGNAGDFFIGASYWHFNRKQADINGPEIFLNPKLQMNGGIKLSTGSRTSLHAEGNWLQQGAQQEMMLASLLSYYLATDDEIFADRPVTLSGGLAYRLNDAIVPIVRVRLGNIESGISYDVNTSSLMSASMSRGGYEFTLTYKGFNSMERSTKVQSRCPRF